MPKTIQGLRKRTGSLAFSRSGKKMDDFGPLKMGDVANVFHENGQSASIKVEIIQEEGTFIGTVERCGKIPGLAVGDDVVENMDFVFVVTRAE